MLDVKKMFTKITELYTSTSFDNGRVLFDNDNQSMAGAITLSDSAANYDMFVICFKTQDNAFDSLTVYNPNGKDIVLTSANMNAYNTTEMWIKSKILTISGTSINTKQKNNVYLTGEINAAGSNTAYVADKANITQVIGYKLITRF